jgi:hypothetical protein
VATGAALQAATRPPTSQPYAFGPSPVLNTGAWLRYREQSFHATSGPLELEEHWYPANPGLISLTQDFLSPNPDSRPISQA